jgi:nucleotide-binding universal stress UspA family protein
MSRPERSTTIGAKGDTEMKTIVLGYDDSAEAARATQRTAELAKALDARVIVASVAPILMPAARGIGPYDPTDPPERHEALARDAAALLEERGVDAECVTSMGDPGETIVKVADAHEADLIVLGMADHPHLARLLGSVSDDVAHHAHCDVLLVH